MKLMTKAIAKGLKAGTEAATPEPTPIVVKYFHPASGWTWFATEGEKVGPGPNDWILFGLVEGFETELGSFSLAELAAIKGPMGLSIERDLHFTGMAIQNNKVIEMPS